MTKSPLITVSPAMAGIIREDNRQWAAERKKFHEDLARELRERSANADAMERFLKEGGQIDHQPDATARGRVTAQPAVKFG